MVVAVRHADDHHDHHHDGKVWNGARMSIEHMSCPPVALYLSPNGKLSYDQMVC